MEILGCLIIILFFGFFFCWALISTFLQKIADFFGLSSSKRQTDSKRNTSHDTSRSPHQHPSRKIFRDDEGEYVDFEEVKSPKTFCVVIFALLTLLPLHADELPRIDYLVVYDQAAKAWINANGKTMEGHANDIVTSLNQCMENSHIDGRYRLAGCMEISNTAKDCGEGLSLGRTTEVKKKKADVKADIVCVLIEHSQYDGVTGSSIQAALSGVADDAICAVRCSSAVSGFVAAHETAHVMGCGHSRAMIDAGKHEYAVACERGKYMTLLSSGEGSDADTHLLMLSGPGNYAPDGKTEMGSATEDNSRMVREKWELVAGFSEANPNFVLTPNVINAPIEGLAEYHVTTDPENVSIYIESFTEYPWLDAYIPGRDGDTHHYTSGTSGEDDIIITVSKNATGKPRTGYITLTGYAYLQGVDYAPTVITINQDGAQSTDIQAFSTSHTNLSNSLFDLSGRPATDRRKGVKIFNGKKVLR